MCWMHPAEEEDARLLGIRHAVGKGKANRSSVWSNRNERVACHIYIAASELLHHVFYGVTNWVPHVCRIGINKLYERGRVNFWLHWAERCPCWEHRSDLL